MGIPRTLGSLFGDPHHKDYSISGSILGSPYLCIETITFARRFWKGCLSLQLQMVDTRICTALLSKQNHLLKFKILTTVDLLDMAWPMQQNRQKC